MKSTPSERAEQPALQRTLSNRHIQLMAMGGAIGTGLFMGSGKSSPCPAHRSSSSI